MRALPVTRRRSVLIGLVGLIVPGLLLLMRTPAGDADMTVSVGTISELVPTVSAGVSVSFGSADPPGGIYETAGWYPREAGFVWTQGSEHRLLILVDAPFVGSACSLVLSLEVEGFVPSEEVGPRTLTLRVAQMEHTAAVPAGRSRVEVPLTFGALPETIVVDGSIDALDPRRYGSTDGRLLGMRLYAAELDGLSACGAR